MKKENYYAVWYITDRYNFNCKYCYSHNTNTNYSILPVKNIIKTLRQTKKPWTIGITGGEPFILPNFIELCKELIKYCEIKIDTNLSIGSKVKEFANSIDPKKAGMYISTHIEEREKRNQVKEFINNLLLLKEKGFKYRVNYVLHPTLTKRFKKDYKYFKSRGIELEPKPFKGEYNGKTYPFSYSKNEKKIILKYSTRSFRFIPFYSEGLKCNAGKTFVQIQNDGTIIRCSADKTIMGTVFEEFRLNKKAEPCKVKVCPCYRHFLIVDEDKNERLKEIFKSDTLKKY